MGQVERVGAVVAALLMVTSMFAPVVGGSATGSTEISNEAATSTVDSNVDVSGQPALILKGRAVNTVDKLAASKKRQESARTRAFELLNGTLSAYRGPTRIESRSVLEDDADAVRALSAYAETSQQANASRASRLVLAADNASAYQKLADARYLLNATADDIDDRGERRSMEAHLENAERAYERAEAAMTEAENADGKQAFQQRARAIEYLRQTWHQAQYVVVSADQHTTPTVRIVNRQDPVRTASGPVNRTVGVEISSAHPATLERVNASVNGQLQREQNLSAFGAGPDENISVQLSVPLDGRVNRIEVSLTERDENWQESEDEDEAESRDDGKGKNGANGKDEDEKKDSDEKNRGKKNGKKKAQENGKKKGQDKEKGQSEGTDKSREKDDSSTPTLVVVSAVVELDGDGLTDRYETGSLGTDPLNPDSDSTETESDESDDGTIDGREDFDSDELGTLEELELGTDPLDPDTDDDRLIDGDEPAWTQTDPLDADTDGDGVPDAEEDPDEDALTHAEEIDVGTDPLYPDTDGDALNDSRELELGTDPISPDTDEDFLRDGVELQPAFDTDPLNPDTDGDGILDGNETYESETTNESLGVTVKTTGQGNTAAGTTVRSTGEPGFRNATSSSRTSSLVTVRTSDSTENLTVSLAYDPSAVTTNSSDLAVYRYNRTAQFFERLNSSVNADSSVVNGTAGSDGTFTLLATSVRNDRFESPENFSNATVDKDQFESPENCTGACSSNGEEILVGPLADSNSNDETNSSNSTSSNVVDPALPTVGQRGAVENDTGLDMNVSENTTIEYRFFENGTILIRVGNETERRTPGNGSASSVGSYPGMPALQSRATLLAQHGFTFHSRTLHEDATEVEVEALIDSATGPASLRADGETVFSLSEGETATNKRVDKTISVTGGETFTLSLTASDGGGIGLDTWSLDVKKEDPDNGGGGGGGGGEPDLCEAEPGTQGVECPNSSVSIVSVDVDQPVEELSIVANGEAIVNGQNSYASLEVAGVQTDELVRATSNQSISVERTYTDLSPSNGDTKLAVAAVTRGMAGMRIDSFTIRKDTDGDGLYDSVEKSGIETDTFGHVKLEYDNTDSDGDGLPDNEEVGSRRVDRDTHKVYWTLQSHPNSEDGDFDGITDPDELEGWTVRFDERHGEPYRWNPNGSGTDRFDSSPLYEKTDGDRLSDDEEKHLTHTDPRSVETYGITAEHEETFKNTFGGDRSPPGEFRLRSELGVRSSQLPVETIEDPDFTDATDSFDLVTADGESGASQFTFTALDGTERTDYWVSNADEVRVREHSIAERPKLYRMDPWDPDTDDDGLTDGQEVDGVTVTQDESQETYFPNPADPDTDGDGYWDGWMGVYDVGRTDNVVLYREHLQSGDGVEGDEIVQEQLGVHEASKAPSATSADLPEMDGGPYHSNIHVGELQWETGLRDDSDSETPHPNVTVEIDYYEGTPEALHGQEWRDRISANYELYGVDVNFVSDRVDDGEGSELITQENLEDANRGGRNVFNPPYDQFDGDELDAFRESDEFHDNQEALHLLVVPYEWGPNGPTEQTGESSPGDSMTTAWLSVYTGSRFHDPGQIPDRFDTTRRENLQILTARTAVHEFGHYFLAGEADDPNMRGEEVYSGHDDDPTNEFVEAGGQDPKLWSVMAETNEREAYISPTGVNYTAYSLEELFTITTETSVCRGPDSDDCVTPIYSN